MDDVIEMPLQRCLYRQSSLETRLTPEVPPRESDEEDETSDEEIKNITMPRVVNTVLKTPQAQLDADIGKKLDKKDIKSKLEDVIRKHPERKVSRSDKTQAEMLQDEMQITLATQQRKKTATPRTSLIENRQSVGKILPNEARSCSPRPVAQCSIKPTEEDDVMRVIPTMKDIKKIDSKNKMATLRPKSPRPAVPPRTEKEESIWDKLGTLGRKKRIKEVQEVQAEGKYAIDSPSNPVFPAVPPEEYELDENEERSMVEPGALDDPKVQELTQILIEWINDELASQRIIVQDLAEDLYDGQVLQKLLEKLTSYKMDVPEVTQSEEGQKQKLAVVLAHCNNVLGVHRSSPKKWGVEAIHTKNIVAILYLLVALARHFRAPIRLPEHVSIKTVVVQKTSGQLSHRFVHENITSAYDDVGMRCERDAFDTLFDHAPDKLQVVKKSMVTFVNKHLNKINLEVTELETQFHDGVYLTLLMGLLEGFFVPLYCFHLTPKDFDQKVHNVAFAFELMEEVGISKLKARPEDIVNMDLKSTLRVLYQLFSRYKDIL